MGSERKAGWYRRLIGRIEASEGRRLIDYRGR